MKNYSNPSFCVCQPPMPINPENIVCVLVGCPGYQAGKCLWDQYASSPSAKWKQVQFTDLESHWLANAHTYTHSPCSLCPLLFGDSPETASHLACCERSREGGVPPISAEEPIITEAGCPTIGAQVNNRHNLSE